MLWQGVIWEPISIEYSVASVRRLEVLDLELVNVRRTITLLDRGCYPDMGGPNDQSSTTSETFRNMLPRGQAAKER